MKSEKAMKWKKRLETVSGLTQWVSRANTRRAVLSRWRHDMTPPHWRDNKFCWQIEAPEGYLTGYSLTRATAQKDIETALRLIKAIKKLAVPGLYIKVWNLDDGTCNWAIMKSGLTNQFGNDVGHNTAYIKVIREVKIHANQGEDYLRAASQVLLATPAPKSKRLVRRA